MSEEAMLRRLYLRLGLLGGRRRGDCGCCETSPVVTAEPLPLPALPSCCCCRALLLPERERACWLCPWLRLWLWPSDGDGFDVSALL